MGVNRGSVSGLSSKQSPNPNGPIISPDPHEIKWVENKSLFYPFSEAIGREIMEFHVKGNVTKAFIRGNSDGYPHNISVKLEDRSQIEMIRTIVSKSPNLVDSETYHWSFINTVAKFSSKENPTEPFQSRSSSGMSNFIATFLPTRSNKGAECTSNILLSPTWVIKRQKKRRIRGKGRAMKTKK